MHNACIFLSLLSFIGGVSNHAFRCELGSSMQRHAQKLWDPVQTTFRVSYSPLYAIHLMRNWTLVAPPLILDRVKLPPWPLTLCMPLYRCTNYFESLYMEFWDILYICLTLKLKFIKIWLEFFLLLWRIRKFVKNSSREKKCT